MDFLKLKLRYLVAGRLGLIAFSREILSLNFIRSLEFPVGFPSSNQDP